MGPLALSAQPDSKVNIFGAGGVDTGNLLLISVDVRSLWRIGGI